MTPGDADGDNTDTMLVVSWEMPIGSEPMWYQVSWRPVGDYSDWRDEPRTADTMYTIGGLNPGTGYLVTVRASNTDVAMIWGDTDVAMIWGPRSDLVEGVTAAGMGSPGLSRPDAPTGLAVTPGDADGNNVDTMITAMWDAPSGIVGGSYEVAWRPVSSPDWVHEASTMETSHTIDALSPGIVYLVAVRASHSGNGTAWGSWSDLVRGSTAAGMPVAPTPYVSTGLAVTPGDADGNNVGTMITAMWDAPSGIVGGSYEVAWRSVDTSDWLNESATADTSYTIDGLIPGTFYLVAVRASHSGNGTAWGPWSDAVRGSTAAGMPVAPTPYVPTGLEVTPGDGDGSDTSTMITAMWDAPSGTVDGMYQVAWRPVDATRWMHEAATADTSYTIDGLTPGTFYLVAVRASYSDAAAWGSWSDAAEGSTYAGSGIPGLPTPGAPTGLVLTPGAADGSDTGTMITAMWDAPSGIVGGLYEVAWRPADAAGWVHEVGTRHTTRTIDGLLPNTDYWVAVRASNTGTGTAWGPWSDLVRMSTPGRVL